MPHDLRLTKRLIDSLDEPGLYWDSQLRGFGLQISGTTKTYVVQARINGKSSRQKIARHGVLTPEQARDEARQRLAQMAAGIDPRQARRALSQQGVTLKEALDAYFANRELAPRTQADYRKVLADHLSCWQSTPLASISQDMVETQHAKLGESHGHAQANMAMRLLKAIFNFAEGKYQRADGSPLVTTNPTKRLNALRRWYKTPRRENYIREEQLQAWHAGVLAMNDASPTEGTRIIQDYLLFVLFTGLRRTEAASIQWEHVNFQGRRLTIPRENTKNGTNFELPLTSATLEILKRRLDARNNEFVFPGTGKTGHLVEPKKQIAKVIADTGIQFTVHDLRRTFATYADTVVQNEATVKRLMNHLTGNQDVTEGYKQGVERLRGPAQRVTDYILELIEHGLRT